nr:hypothetical protein [uncultured Algoriphagus sp.]
MSKDFVSLVLISILLAMPMAWYLADLWLESYAFQTDLSWWIFADSSLLLVLIALLTVGYQAFQAARNNPVNSLKSE